MELLIPFDRSIRNQVSQVRSGLRSAIVDGRLTPGTKLPSSRSLAQQLGVNRNAIVAAHEHLSSDGLVEARHGGGTYVATTLPAPAQATGARVDIRPYPRRAFALGCTLADPALLRRLGNAARRHIVSATPGELGYGDPRGHEYLRTQIALHLAANRGVRCDPSCIVIVSGTQQAIRLCADALLAPGDVVWFEDPGYPAARTTLRAAGMRPLPVPVDDEGIVVASGRNGGASAKAAYVTPSHQFPMGVTMSMTRRTALLDWAREASAWIIEDDYDSEFRYAGPPLTALAGIGAERVIYVGTCTKTLFAGLRLAYMALPPQVVEPIVAARAAQDRFPPSLLQSAVAELMADGSLAAHVRRMRIRYRKARDTVAATLASAAGGLRVVVPTQGLHLLALLPPGSSPEAATRMLASADVEARLLSEARIVQGGREGLILGFSGHSTVDLEAASHRLGVAAQEER